MYQDQHCSLQGKLHYTQHWIPSQSNTAEKEPHRMIAACTIRRLKLQTPTNRTKATTSPTHQLQTTNLEPEDHWRGTQRKRTTLGDRVPTRAVVKLSNDRTENMLCQEPDHNSIGSGSELARSPIRQIPSQKRHENGRLTYKVQHADTTYSNNVSADHVPHMIVKNYDQQTRALTEHPKKMYNRRRHSREGSSF